MRKNGPLYKAGAYFRSYLPGFKGAVVFRATEDILSRVHVLTFDVIHLNMKSPSFEHIGSIEGLHLVRCKKDGTLYKPSPGQYANIKRNNAYGSLYLAKGALKSIDKSLFPWPVQEAIHCATIHILSAIKKIKDEKSS